MKNILFYTDTETTGFFEKKDQILSYAIVLCNKEDVVSEEEIKILLKKTTLPSLSALLVNNINPFSTDFKKNALTEFEAALYFKDKIDALKRSGNRITFIAYNAGFDIKFYTEFLKRYGFDFNQLFDICYDPLITAGELIESKDLKTKVVNLRLETQLINRKN